MADLDNDWSDWNPMAQHYNNENSKKYESVSEAPAKNVTKDRNTKQMQYPYLIIKKKNEFITERMLSNFFGDSIIYDIEYRKGTLVYFVYFHNIGSLETAWTKIRQFPNIVSCVEGRPQQDQSNLPYQINDTQDKNPPESLSAPSGDDAVDLKSRTIAVSINKSKHPEFIKPPVVIKADYGRKNSLLSVNDPSKRYLNVKYEFMLERRGAYKLQDIIEIEKAVSHFRSGRVIVTPQTQTETKEYVGDESKLAQLAKKCLACNCYTDNSCKFCRMPFCNPVCFDALATAHKESCDKGIPLIIQDSLAQKIINVKLPPSGSGVKITAFQQSNVFYVRSADINSEIAYYKVLYDVMKQGHASPQLGQLPQCGQFVIYKFDKQIVRAIVLNVDNPLQIYVVSVDYGSVEITTLDTLHECSDSLAALPCYAVPVQLRGVPRRYMYPNLRDKLYDLDHSFTFVLKYSEREFDFEMGMHRVILIESEMHHSLNRLLKTIVTPVEPTCSDIGYKEDYLPYVELPTGKDIEMVVMDNTLIKAGVINCTILDYAYEITQMQRDIQFYGESVAKCACYAPPKGDLCVAKYQGKWCRGVSMELVGDGYPSICFIDYGHFTPIHVNDIRPYPPQLILPILTTEYELLGLPDDLSDEQVTRLEKHLAIGAIIYCDEVVYNERENNYSLRIDALQALIK